MALNIFNPNNGRGGVFAQGGRTNDIVSTWVLDTSNLAVSRNLSGPIDLSGNDTILTLAGDDVIVDLSQANDGRGGNLIYGGRGSDRMVVMVGGNLLHGDQSHPSFDQTTDSNTIFGWGGASDIDHAQYHFMGQGIRVTTVSRFTTLGRELQTDAFGFSDTRSAYIVDLNGSSNSFFDIQGNSVDNALRTLRVDLLIGVESLVGTRFNDAFLLQHGAHAVAVNSGAGDDWIEKAAGDARIYAGTGNDTVTLGTVFGSSDGVRIVDGGAGNDTVRLSSRDVGLLIEGVNPFSALGQALAQNTQNGLDLWNGKARDATSAYTVVELGLQVNPYDALQEGAYGANNTRLAATGFSFGHNAAAAGIDRAELLVNVQRIVGTDKNDTFLGRGGVDVFDGGAGNDFFDGRAGKDRFTGGAGNDTFSFSVAQAPRNGYTATITDFDQNGDDMIRVTGDFNRAVVFRAKDGSNEAIVGLSNSDPTIQANQSQAFVRLTGVDFDTDVGGVAGRTAWLAANVEFV